MKNKFFYIIIIFSQLIFTNLNSIENFKIESPKFELKDKGNILNSFGGVKIEYANEIEIFGERSIFNKLKNEVQIFGNVKVKDIKKNITIKTEKLIFNKKKQILKSPEETIIEIDNKYTINGSDLVYSRKLFIFKSDKKATVTDNLKNKFEAGRFVFRLNDEILEANELSLIDINKNNTNLEDAYVNFKNNEVVGKNIFLRLDKEVFGDINNDPRFKGKSFVSNEYETIIYKGVFTPCKKTKKCPPWSIKADEIRHKKIKKSVEYKNAWLEIYDKPVVYFPKFFHPDPTVKRQSGFLIPAFGNSKNMGGSFKIPYYKVLSGNRDLTFSPRFFLDKNLLLQNEFRQANKNSDFIADFSANNILKDDFQSHFFSNLKGERGNIDYEINIQTVSNDVYLKTNKLQSPLIEDYDLLRSYANFENNHEDYFLSTSFEIYEDLTKRDNDRFEYIYPNYLFAKEFNFSKDKNKKVSFVSEGFQKHYQTNTYEAIVVNDIKYNTNQKIFNSGFVNDFEFLIRNVNSDSENSSNYKKDVNYEFLSSVLFKTSYPLIKKGNKNTKYFSAIFSAKYSPNQTKDISNEDRYISYENIFLMDRFGKNDFVEGGQSISLGLEFNNINNSDGRNVFNFGVAQIYRDNENLDLPEKTNLNQKTSDLVGNLNIFPTENFGIEYSFAVDNSLDHNNYNFVKANLKVNKLVTSFEFLEEDNNFGDKSYLANKTTFGVNDKNFVSLNTRKNLDKDITEFYNLIYEYKNNCLTASLEYNKEYYKDVNLEPEENIFFKLTLKSLGEISSPSLK